MKSQFFESYCTKVDVDDLYEHTNYYRKLFSYVAEIKLFDFMWLKSNFLISCGRRDAIWYELAPKRSKFATKLRS